MSNQLEMTAAKHGFEAALVMCGKTVNEDASLGFAHTTAGAKQVRNALHTQPILLTAS